MSVVGLGRAYRDQEREARRQRERREKRMDSRRDKNHAEDWGAATQQQAACMVCGGEDAVGNLYHTGDGFSCAVCFSEGEDEIAAAPVAPAWKLLLRGLPFLLLPVPVLAHNAGWYELGDPHPYLTIAWLVSLMGASFGSPWALMHIASVAKEDYHRPGIEARKRRRLLLGHTWLAFALVAGVVASFWLLYGQGRVAF